MNWKELAFLNANINYVLEGSVQEFMDESVHAEELKNRT